MPDFHKADCEKVYAAMEKDLRTAILKGELRTDVPILTEGEFESEYKISRKSVRKAIQNLCNEGLLVKLQGSGTYVVPPEKRAKTGDKKNLRILFLSNQFKPDIKPSAEYVESLVNGMSEFAFRMNWQVNFIFLDNADFDEIIADYRNALFNGVIWDNISESRHCDVLKLRDNAVPQLTMNPQVEGVCSICYDHQTEIIDTVSFLKSLGHTKIAFINADINTCVYQVRERSFIDSVKKFSLTEDFYFRINITDVINCAESIFSRAGRPTALILGGHSFLAPFLGWAATRKLCFPEDVSLICLDDSYVAKSHNPPVSVYAEPRNEIGRQVLLAMERIINGQMLPGEQIKIKGDLLIRKSCGLPPK